MNHIAGQPVPQAAGFQSAMWYYNDVLMNPQLQLQVAVPTVQVISAAASQSPISTPPLPSAPAPTATSAPALAIASTQAIAVDPAPPATPIPPAHINVFPEKPKNIKKEPQEDRERNFCCEVCGTTFTNSSNLRIHMKIHLGVRPYVCSECGKSFIQSSNLKTHKRIHTGERPYKCTECGQTFSRSSHLVGHKRIHTGEKPYICGICGVAFYTSSHMRNHVRRHTGEKPYVCPLCGEAFNQTSELRAHVRHHSGEKCFKCRKCHDVFFSSPELKAHCKVKHSSSKPFKCDKCDRCFRTIKFFTKHNVKCTGPRPKRPKGRPPKYPRDENGESAHKKPKNQRIKKPVAPSDRISRSKTRALRIAKMKVEVEAEEEQLKTKALLTAEMEEEAAAKENQLNKREIMPVFEQESDVLDDSGSSEFNEGTPLKNERLPESDEHIPQLPMVHVMLDNFSSGAEGLVIHSVPSETLQGPHSLTDEREEFGVMDLSGQQIHEVDHQHDSDAQTPMNFLPTQSMSVVTADHQLPLVPDQEEQLSLDHHQVTTTIVNQHSLINHQKQPISTTFQQSVSALPLSVTNSVTTAGSMTAIPQVSAHHQTVANFVGQVTSNPHSHSQPQLSVVPAHQHSSSVNTHQVPAVTAHQHLPSVTSIHSASSSHLQLPTINAHQGQLGGGLHQQTAPLTTSLENTVTAHQNLNLTIASNHQQISTTSAHHMLPVVSAHQQQQLSTVPTQQLSTTANTQLSTGVSHHHVVNSHHQLPVVSAHQQAVTNHLQLPSVSSRHSLPTILTAHQGSSAVQQQQQQHMVAVTAHQSVSSVLQQHMPAITAHQQIASATDQQITTAHFPNTPSVVSGVHPQSLLVTAHQPHVVPFLPVYKHSCNLGSTEDTSQVLYEGGQSFVVDLSSPALTQQVTLVDPTVTSHSTKH
ncbi:uncharacterized protein [Palaemon carinicauda]|uniref:uncharacterized protein n=1 Tax=Palaemon carinicauda TaxID=392227 RepID=UPI0035B5C954